MGNKFEDIKVDIADGEFKDYVGDSAYKFTAAKDRVLEGKHTAHSWWALLFGVFYSVYYKHWSVFYSFVLLTAVIALIAGEANQQAAISAAGLLTSIYCYFRFKYDYVKSAYKKIHKIKQLEDDEERLKRLLLKKGGTSWLNVVIAIAVVAVLSTITASTEERKEIAQSIESIKHEVQAVQQEVNDAATETNIFDDADSIFDE
jgi:hypothetical protein